MGCSRERTTWLLQNHQLAHARATHPMEADPSPAPAAAVAASGAARVGSEPCGDESGTHAHGVDQAADGVAWEGQKVWEVMSPPVVKGISASGSDQDLPPLSGRCDQRRDQNVCWRACVLRRTHVHPRTVITPVPAISGLDIPVGRSPFPALRHQWWRLQAWAYGYAILPEEDGRLCWGGGKADSLP